jgi:hypothetical protein
MLQPFREATTRGGGGGRRTLLLLPCESVARLRISSLSHTPTKKTQQQQQRCKTKGQREGKKRKQQRGIRTITPPLSICANPCLTRTVPTSAAAACPPLLPFPLVGLASVILLAVAVLRSLSLLCFAFAWMAVAAAAAAAGCVFVCACLAWLGLAWLDLLLPPLILYFLSVSRLGTPKKIKQCS